MSGGPSGLRHEPGGCPHAKIEFRDLTIGYRGGRPVLSGLHLEVTPGEVLAVVGPNASGKTTLFRTVLGVLPPLGGRVLVSGLTPADYRARNGVGYLAEDTALPHGWTSNRLLALAAAAAGDGADITNACRLAGVDYATEGVADELSKGMKRRLALAMALMRPAGLLLLDEPESGLDPGQRIRLRRRIEEVRGAMTVLVASHDLGELAIMSNRVLVVDQGQGHVVERPEDGFSREFLEHVFLELRGSVS